MKNTRYKAMGRWLLGILLGTALLIFSGCLPEKEILKERETGKPCISTVSEEAASRDDVINVLLIGQDRRPGEERTRSDAMILCSVDRGRGRIVFTSFLRDLYVEIPGYGKDRLNVPYVLGGAELLDQTLEENYGVRIDGNVEVDFAGFAGAMDTLGGVEVSLSAEEAAYLNEQAAGWKKKPVFHEGVNRLSGQAALAYCRIRSIDSDFGRTERQRKVLMAVAEKCKGASLGEMLRLVEALSPWVKTDMSGGQMIACVAAVMPMLKNMTVQSQRIPVEGSFQETCIDGMDVIVADAAENRAFLENTICGK